MTYKEPYKINESESSKIREEKLCVSWAVPSFVGAISFASVQVLTAP